MKIGFTGSGGTGKTTTLGLVSKDFVSIPILSSPARAIFAKWGIKEAEQETMSVGDRIKLQNEIYEARFKEEIIFPSFISDRTLLDNFAYHLFRCYEGINDEELHTYKKRTCENLRTYDFVFYFPLFETVEVDGFRYSNISYQTMIDSIIFSFLVKNNIKYEVVPEGTAIQRAIWISNKIKEKVDVKGT